MQCSVGFILLGKKMSNNSRESRNGCTLLLVCYTEQGWILCDWVTIEVRIKFIWWTLEKPQTKEKVIANKPGRKITGNSKRIQQSKRRQGQKEKGIII
jgi:hypothetical protein